MQNFEHAKTLADAASNLDFLKREIPAELRYRADKIVDTLHGIAMQLAVDRVEEIYGRDKDNV